MEFLFKSLTQYLTSEHITSYEQEEAALIHISKGESIAIHSWF